MSTIEHEGRVTRTRPAATFDRLRKKKPLERTVRVCLDSALLDQLEAAEVELFQARQLKSGIAEAEARVAEAKEAVEQETEVCVFRSIGRRAYEELQLAHPPTEEDNEAAKESGSEDGAAYNTDTFPHALIAASCVDPEMTEEEARELFDEWNTAEWLQLWTAALEVNSQARQVQLGKGSG